MGYVTKNDSEHAQRMEARWLACSEEAREFAAWNLGRFPFGTLPHVIAEQYDLLREEGRQAEMYGKFEPKG